VRTLLQVSQELAHALQDTTAHQALPTLLKPQLEHLQVLQERLLQRCAFLVLTRL